MAKDLIMVMGVQRSGTTALFNSLARDKTLTAFDESIDSSVYYKYRLRPLAEIAPVLDAAPRGLLLKPLSETGHRTIQSVFEEFRNHALRVVWIYRDPLSVLYSMHREGWIPRSQIENAMHIPGWEKRNRLALQFQEHHPKKIAIIRYEDCFMDPQVFKALNAWLGVKGKSLFRKDSSQARQNISLAAQQQIDAAAAKTLQALDAARTFKPRRIYRLKHRVARAVADFRKIQGAAVDNCSDQRQPFDWGQVRFPGPAMSPAATDGLQFWLDGSVKAPGAGDRVSGWRENGPHHMEASNVMTWPFHIPCLNRKHALFFPTEEINERRASLSEILRFGAGYNWAFLFDGGPFSLFALFSPNPPNYSPYNQQRAIVLRIGPRDHRAPALVLEWEGSSNASKGVIIRDNSSSESSDQNVRIKVSTPPGSHFQKEWRIIHLQHQTDTGCTLSIAANGIEGLPVLGIPAQELAPGIANDCELFLGGDETESESLFYGAVAEVIIFNRALETNEHLGITRYLKEKYQL